MLATVSCNTRLYWQAPELAVSNLLGEVRTLVTNVHTETVVATNAGEMDLEIPIDSIVCGQHRVNGLACTQYPI